MDGICPACATWMREHGFALVPLKNGKLAYLYFDAKGRVTNHELVEMIGRLEELVKKEERTEIR